MFNLKNEATDEKSEMLLKICTCYELFIKNKNELLQTHKTVPLIYRCEGTYWIPTYM